MRAIVGLALGVLLLSPSSLHAQSVAVELDDVTDNRVEAGEFRGTLEVRVKLTGTAAEKAKAARVLVKEAKDNKGNALVRSGVSSTPDFTPREYNNGTINFALSSPARAATTVKVKGTIELFDPKRDPGAVVKIEKALTRLDAPLASKTLKAAKIELTPLSVAAYRKAREAKKLDEKKIAEIRAEGKKRGVSEKEVELMIGLAQALESAHEEPTEATVMLSGNKDAFERIFQIDILGDDGEPLHITSRSTSSWGDDSLMTLQPSSPPPANATMVLHLLTPKSKVTSPFELSVELP
jgi:hypothetical protein